MTLKPFINVASHSILKGISLTNLFLLIGCLLMLGARTVSAADTTLGLSPLITYTIQQMSNSRYLDAHEHEAKNFRLVTRPAQYNDTQRWKLTPLGNDKYTIQQESNNRFVDAHEGTGENFDVVTRSAQNNNTQRWKLTPLGNDMYTIQQVSNNRFVDAYEHAGKNFGVVTRSAQNNDTQRWRIKPVNIHTIQQVSNSRFVDAHGDEGEDFRLVTRPIQNNNTQRWKFTYLGSDNYTIQQESNNRFVDAHEGTGENFDVVTRSAQNNDTQKWKLKPLGNDKYTIQQVSNNRFVDAHEHAGEDFSLVTRPAQNNNTQKWKLRPVTFAAETIQRAATKQGAAWPSIQSKIDALAKDLIVDHNLPGVSIAASKNDKLAVAQSYGYANTDTAKRLDSDLQIHIGSNTKPLVTGAVVWKVMANADLDPQTTLLYGPTGIYGGKFKEDIAIGAASTDTPINWYYQITVQHLLDHKAGYKKASTAETIKYFNIDMDNNPEELTYELIHKHFLQTRELRWEPGTKYKYANHHFGSMKLIVEALTGVDFVDYVASEHLGPLGLNGEIEIIDNPPRPNTADPHTYKNGEPAPYVADYSDSTGFAAGGYRGSARDVVELMTKLAETYTPKELDRMGFGSSGVTPDMAWGDGTGAYIAHSGRISGGTSYIRMTVDGINITIQTNIDNKESTADLISTVSEIVELLRQADIPSHYDLWAGCTLPKLKPGSTQVARHGIPVASYQCHFDQLTGAGYRLDWLDASTVGNKTLFNVVFVPDSGNAWSAFHGLSGRQYQRKFDKLVNKGFRPVQIDSYLSGGRVRYTGFFEKTRGSEFAAYHGISSSEHQDRFDDLTDKGFRPTSLSVVSAGGQSRYTAVYEKGLVGSLFVKSKLTLSQYQVVFNEQQRQGRWPVYLNGYNDANGTARLVAIFSSLPGNGVRARHGLTSAGYQTAWEDATDDSLLTDVVTAYQSGNGVRYAAVWSRP